jgi:hypothetical protein
MQGDSSPYASARTLTVGRLAGLVRELAARPADWWHLVSFDGVPVRLAAECGLWLTAWPPGHRADPHAGLLAVLAGELAEQTITERGVAERTLRANRVQVYGGGSPRELVNPGPGFAISLHTTGLGLQAAGAGQAAHDLDDHQAGDDRRERPGGGRLPAAEAEDDVAHGQPHEQDGGQQRRHVEPMPEHA